MNSQKTSSGSSPADKRAFQVSLVVFIGSLFILIFLNNRSAFAPSDSGQQPGQHMTLEPAVIANLTAFPDAPRLTGELADQVHQIQTMLNACPDYGTARRSQMQQHIDWLLNPSTIPQEMLIAIGANPNGRLIVGMATYTTSEWTLAKHPPASCLVPIGQTLNTMLAAQGEETFEEFE